MERRKSNSHRKRHPSEEQLYDYLEATLTKQKRQAIKAHFTKCRACAKKLETMASVLWLHDNWAALAPRKSRQGAVAARQPHKASR
jgi:anti-sigma factor ChrR (cupin superfamily)